MKGRLVCVRNVDSKRIHYGVLEEVSAELVVVRKPKETVTMNLQKVRLLDPAEADAWQAENLPRRKNFLSFMAPENLDPEFVASLASSLAKVLTVSVVDVYDGAGVEKGKKKVSFHIETPATEVGEEAMRQTKQLLIGLGCVMV